ncbi:MAG: 4Fe-4S dicluster domain-containing protein [Eubacteriales bacterium]|nr:4Fe-4S dicluster domain-containing protein [Eubacteriales bacterium]
MVRIPLERLDALFEAIAAQRRLYLPADDANGLSHFVPWQKGVQLSRRYNTERSAKDFFFPQTEDIVSFVVEGKTIEVVDERKEAEDFVVFGVRACDVRAFSILDKVYLSEPVDSFYRSRREHGLIIALACARPEETCFCSTFGIDAAEPEGDVAAWMDAEALYLRAQSQKGEALLFSLAGLFEAGGEEAVRSQQESTRAILRRLPLASLQAEDFTGRQLEIFRSEKWAELSKACLGCGSCTFVCPTCQCYDIRDFDTGHGVRRYRCWDSCMYSEFTRMAHGNPRLTQLERFRQRFMHKIAYYPANNDGEYGCVGCGRCLRKCPISMNITKVMKSLGEGNA